MSLGVIFFKAHESERERRHEVPKKNALPLNEGIVYIAQSFLRALACLGRSRALSDALTRNGCFEPF